MSAAASLEPVPGASVPGWAWSLAAVALRDTAAPPRDGWAERFDAVVEHGLAGLLAAAHADGRIALDGPTATRLEEQVLGEAELAVRLEAELLRLGPLLAAHGAVVLKGAALAHGAYAEPGWRPFTDLDVLVVGREVPELTAGLVELGYRRPRPDPSPRFGERVAKATALVHPTGLHIDVHRTMAAGAAGAGIDVAGTVRDPRTVRAGSVRVPAPAWEAHLVEVCLHAAVGDGFARALSVLDVAVVAAHPSLDPAGAAALARQWRVEATVGAALAVARRRLGAALPAPLDALATAIGEQGAGALDPARSTRARLAELRHGSVRQRLAVLRAMVVPSPSYLRWRYGDQPLPRLYPTRWSDLRRRARAARSTR